MPHLRQGFAAQARLRITRKIIRSFRLLFFLLFMPLCSGVEPFENVSWSIASGTVPAGYSIDWNNQFLSIGNYHVDGGNNPLIYKFDGGTLSAVTNSVFGTGASSVHTTNWSPDGKYLAVGGNNDTSDVIVYQFNTTTQTFNPAYNQSLFFGNSSLGSRYNLNTNLLNNAKLTVQGKVLHDSV